MPQMDVAFLTIAELNRLYRSRELSPVEVTKALLARIAAHDEKLHSFLRVTGSSRSPRRRRPSAS
jgi:Asp-tRNA(Asn)/Glu-tRNA(Gln) amidotransferase A subunit family amidase